MNATQVRAGLNGHRTETEAVISTLMLAFAGDPLARWLYPRSEDYLRWYPKGISASLLPALAYNSVYCSPDLSGVAVRLPPGVDLLQDTLQELLDQSIPPDKQDDVIELFTQLETYRPLEPFWYLVMTGVDPIKQNQRIGSSLLVRTLERADITETACYLESSNPKNISLYMRFGFQAIGEVQVGDSPVVIPMVRPGIDSFDRLA